MNETVSPKRSGRDQRLDVFRGLALITIFINHVPGNPLENYTSRNFGFSDAAEAFVLMSGIAVALAYSGSFLRQDYRTAIGRMLRRARTLYLVHVASMALALVILAIGLYVFETEEVARSVNFTRLQTDTVKAIIGLPLLGYQIGYFNILPLYVVLLVAATAYLAIGIRNVWAMLAVSLGVWVFAHLSGINFPNWPGQWGWFFNPIGWQLIFVIGIAIGLSARTDRCLVRFNPVLYALSWGFVIFAGIWVKLEMGAVPGLASLPMLFADTDKGALAFLRLVHVLALTYIVIHTRLIGWLLSTAPFRPIAVIGKNGLVVFALGSVAAIVLQVLFEAWPVSDAAKLAVLFGGLVLQYLVALFFDSRKKAARAGQSGSAAKARPAAMPHQASRAIAAQPAELASR